MTDKEICDLCKGKGSVPYLARKWGETVQCDIMFYQPCPQCRPDASKEYLKGVEITKPKSTCAWLYSGEFIEKVKDD